MRRVVLVLFLFAVLPASAMHILTVDCSGATPGAFTTINAAIASVPSISDKTILIKGTCAEHVRIWDTVNVRLEGNPAATLLHDGSPSEFRILWINRSSEVTVKGLTIGAPSPSTPAFTPMQVQRSTVTIESCTVQGGSALASGGLWIADDARVRVFGSTIQNNTPSGIRQDGGELQLGGQQPGPSNVIQLNPAGLRMRGPAHAGIWGNNVFRDNGSGVIANGGHVFLCCTNGLLFADNVQTGITLNLGATLQANNPVTFENNGLAGVRMLSGSAVLNTGQIFRGNSHAGIANSAAVMATGNVHLELFNAEITGNLGHGVLLEDNSSARLFNNTIRDNRGNGVRVVSMSTAAVFAPNTVTGNATDLFCAPNSFARGDDSGFGKNFCPGFDRSPNPMTQ
jgi:hypothetical protein